MARGFDEGDLTAKGTKNRNLEGEFKPGDHVWVTAADNELIFQNGEHTTSKSTSESRD